MKYDVAIERHFDLVQGLKLTNSWVQLGNYKKMVTGYGSTDDGKSIASVLSAKVANSDTFFVTSRMVRKFEQISDSIADMDLTLSPWDLITDSGFAWFESPTWRPVVDENEPDTPIFAVSWHKTNQDLFDRGNDGHGVAIQYWLDSRSSQWKTAAAKLDRLHVANAWWEEFERLRRLSVARAFEFVFSSSDIAIDWLLRERDHLLLPRLSKLTGLEAGGRPEISDFRRALNTPQGVEAFDQDMQEWYTERYLDVPAESGGKRVDESIKFAPRYVMDTYVTLPFGRTHSAEEHANKRAIRDTFAFWMLLAHKLGRVTGVPASRRPRRRAERQLPRAGDINVVYLRQEVDRDPELREAIADFLEEGSGVRRHMVRPHWKQVWCGSERNSDRHLEWRYIEAYPRGEGPLVNTDRLYVLKR